MTEAVDPFAMPAWAAVLFGNIRKVERPDLATVDAPPPPEPVSLAAMKKKRGRPFGTTKAAMAAKREKATA